MRDRRTPLWVQAGLVGLAGLEAFASVQADDPFNAAIAGLGGVADLVAAARLIARTQGGLNVVLDGPSAVMAANADRLELIELAARSDIPELRQLAAAADDLDPGEFLVRYENILSGKEANLAQGLMEGGLTRPRPKPRLPGWILRFAPSSAPNRPMPTFGRWSSKMPAASRVSTIG